MCEYEIPMRKLLLLTTFSLLTPLAILLNAIAISYLSYQKNNQSFFQLGSSQKQTVAYAALPPVQNATEHEIIQMDARTEILRQFFAKYNSPLEPFAKDVVNYADAYDLDFRLISAIAMQESGLCKKIPVGSNNCWGFGIYGGKITKFEDYKEGIYAVTKTLANNYKKKKGLESPAEIVKMYTPSDTGKWVNGVTHFMEQLQ